MTLTIRTSLKPDTNCIRIRYAYGSKASQLVQLIPLSRESMAIGQSLIGQLVGPLFKIPRRNRPPGANRGSGYWPFILGCPRKPTEIESHDHFWPKNMETKRSEVEHM